MIQRISEAEIEYQERLLAIDIRYGIREADEGNWITVNGSPVFVAKGQTAGSAIKARFGDSGGGGSSGGGSEGGGGGAATPSPQDEFGRYTEGPAKGLLSDAAVVKHTHPKAKEFYDEVDKVASTGGSNKQSTIYATRARDAVVTAYHNDTKGKFVVRKDAKQPHIEKANKLIDMGKTEAIYGKGRVYLH